MSLEDGIKKITADHTERLAYVYCRISTRAGVKLNIVGAQRQRDVAKWPLELGWPEENIRIVDEDHAHSGSTTDRRYGYIEMLNDIMDRQVGAVFSLETARVGRDQADWHFLMKMCGVTGTLVIDQEYVYDTNDGNDHMTLALKALIAQTELRWIKNRLLGAKMEVAKKGNLRFILPTGFIFNPSKKIILDTNEEVQERIRLVFTLFKRLGSVNAVIKECDQKNLTFPTVVRSGPNTGKCDWVSLTQSRLLSMLHNPFYAGAYAYGRTTTKTKIVREDGEPPKVRKYQERLKREEWEIVINEAHPGYITWQEFLENEERLRTNQYLSNKGVRGAPRSGCALLQGIAHCGKCGKSMYVKYSHNRETPTYVCGSANKMFGKKDCQTMPGAGIDQAVEKLFLEAVKPAEIEMSLASLKRIQEQSQKNYRQVASRIKEAEGAATEAEDRLRAADHTNKYAFECLQDDVKKKKEAVARLKLEQANKKGFSLEQLTDEQRHGVLGLAQDLPQVWQAKTTDVVTRKKLLRCLLKEVTLIREGKTARVDVRWKTGAQIDLTIEVLRNGGKRIPGKTIEFIKKLATDHTDEQIATVLNEASILNSEGGPFTRRAVTCVRHRFGIERQPLAYTKYRRDDGRYSVEAVAGMLDVHKDSVRKWCKTGRIDAVKVNHGSETGWWIRIIPEELKAIADMLQRWPSHRVARNKKNELIRTSDASSRAKGLKGGAK